MEHDVLVVGAGPTGLLMAIELKRRGLSVRIIDKSSAPSDKSKAIAIQARTLELFDQIGIVDRFLKQGIRIGCANAVSRGKILAHVEFKRLDSPYPFILSLEQCKTEEILQDHLATLGVKVERNVELLSLEQKEGKVKALLSKGQCSASWLIGCDGAHSTTRKALGLSFAGKIFPKTFALADVQIDWKFPHEEFFLFFNEQGILVVVPLPEAKRYRVIFQSTPTLEEVQRLLRQFADPHCAVKEPRWMTEFSIHSRMAEKYFKERVFLAGDAAHIHSPAGGQGMNTGFQDASNLAWKLALVHQGKADPLLLDTYEVERQHVARRLLKGTAIATHMGTLKNPFAISVRNWILSKVSRRRFFQQKLTRTISQINIHYPPNLAVGPKAGYRAPNVMIGSTDLYALCRGKTGFFVFGPQECLEKLSSVPAERIPLGPDCSFYEQGVIYVIRPDLYIGCVSSDPACIASYFAKL